MQQVDVRVAGGSYPVLIGPGTLGRLDALIDRHTTAPARRIVVSAPGIWRLYERAMPASLRQEPPILIPEGEKHKTLTSVARIYDALIRTGADRATTLIALGGGVVGDITGFAAATYLRGIPCVQVPTTLLAQVDSAIGGKTGVNHALGKNLIGAFHQPSAVVSDPGTLGSLARREFRSGLYEVVKYGVIASPGLFTRLEATLPAIFARDEASLAPVVAESAQIKAEVVGEDERESGRRRILNFGHTAGHALEAITRYRRFRHGEAIAWGMLIAAELGVRRKAFHPADRDALAALIRQMGPLPAIADLPASQAADAIRRDKKVIAGTLHFVLPVALGKVEIVDDVSGRELIRAMKAVGMA
ncbi:MAG: 3-dehydroquinate synthase [Acidobacteriota bacterium]|nr:3-dehydroquinate synthase [Acidobacteriota bacterium]